MKKVSSEEFAKKAAEVEALQQKIGKVHDQLGQMQNPGSMKTSALISNLIALRLYDGPLDLGLMEDLRRTQEGLAAELDRRVPIPLPDVLRDAGG